MDSKSGFRECSRCGLRNKPTAKQCDFCGQKFDAVDEWELQLDALEKLNQETKREEVPEDVSKRIEATIKKKETAGARPEPAAEPVPERAAEVKAPEPAIEPIAAAPVPLTEKEIGPEPEAAAPVAEKQPEAEAAPSPKTEEPTTVITFTAESKPVDVEPEKHAPSVEEPPSVDIEEAKADAQPSVEEEQALPEETAKAEPERARKEEKVRVRKTREKVSAAGSVFKWNFDPRDRTSVAFMAVMIAGIALYIMSMAMSSSLGTIGAWSAIAVSGLMIVVGIAKIAIYWPPAEIGRDTLERHEIVEICPRCNEQLLPGEEKCPACGTEFEPSGKQ